LIGKTCLNGWDSKGSNHWVTPPGWSFPSGHAMGSFVTYGFLAYPLTRVPRADFPRRTALALLAVLVLLIGFSRIYLGAHYLSDVTCLRHACGEYTRCEYCGEDVDRMHQRRLREDTVGKKKS
jgi:membrane-associated phospholipid phosphatase